MPDALFILRQTDGTVAMTSQQAPDWTAGRGNLGHAGGACAASVWPAL